MKIANSKSFESQYGFKSPGFTVDSEGNIVASSISVTSGISNDFISNFIITETISASAFRFQNYAGDNPTITVARGTTYIFELSLTELAFFIKSSIVTGTNYNSGLIHSSGVSGVNAQGLKTGALSFTVPISAPDTLYYSNGASISGLINVVNPAGLFSNVTIADDLTLSGNLILDGVGIPQISSETNLQFNATNSINLLVENNLIGTIDSNGLTIPINTSTIENSSIENSSIENSTIGSTTPTTAAFTTATVTSVGLTGNSITNKVYVDNTATALAIAFGL